MSAQSMTLAAVDVYAMPGDDLGTISFPVVRERMLPPSSLSVIEGDKGNGARGLGTPSSVDYSCETPRRGGEWESDCSKNPGSWVSEFAWLWYR